MNEEEFCDDEVFIFDSALLYIGLGFIAGIVCAGLALAFYALSGG